MQAEAPVLPRQHLRTPAVEAAVVACAIVRVLRQPNMHPGQRLPAPGDDPRHGPPLLQRHHQSTHPPGHLDHQAAGDATAQFPLTRDQGAVTGLDVVQPEAAVLAGFGLGHGRLALPGAFQPDKRPGLALLRSPAHHPAGYLTGGVQPEIPGLIPEQRHQCRRQCVAVRIHQETVPPPG